MLSIDLRFVRNPVRVKEYTSRIQRMLSTDCKNLHVESNNVVADKGKNYSQSQQMYYNNVIAI